MHNEPHEVCVLCTHAVHNEPHEEFVCCVHMRCIMMCVYVCCVHMRCIMKYVGLCVCKSAAIIPATTIMKVLYVHTSCSLVINLKDVSLVEFMYPVLLACQATRVSVVCLFNVRRQLFERNYFPLFVDSTEAL